MFWDGVSMSLLNLKTLGLALSATVSCSNRCQTRILAPSCGSEMELQWHERRDKRVEIGGPHKCRDVPYMCRNYGYLNNQALSPHYLYLAAESGLEACKSRAPPCELGHNLLCAALLVHQQGALQVSPLGGSAVIFVRSPFTPMLSPPSSSAALCGLLLTEWRKQRGSILIDCTTGLKTITWKKVERSPAIHRAGERCRGSPRRFLHCNEFTPFPEFKHPLTSESLSCALLRGTQEGGGGREEGEAG